mgnify:CR=1 FL=1|jgi:hypothetical protein
MNREEMIKVLESQNETVLTHLISNYLTKEGIIELIKNMEDEQIQELVDNLN